MKKKIEIHIHPAVAQIVDGTDLPIAIMQSPRGDPLELALVAGTIADALSVPCRRFDLAGKEIV